MSTIIRDATALENMSFADTLRGEVDPETAHFRQLREAGRGQSRRNKRLDNQSLRHAGNGERRILGIWTSPSMVGLTIALAVAALGVIFGA